MFERILVPLDGSILAEAVLPSLSTMARRCGSKVLLVRAYSTSMDERHEAEAYLELVRRRVEADGILTEGFVLPGEPAAMILKVAQEEAASLLAMSTHGRTGLSRLLFGSVAEEIMRAAPCPLFLVRAFQSAFPPSEETPFKFILLPVDGTECIADIVPPIAAFARRFGSRVVILHVADGSTDRKEAPANLRSVRESLAAEGVESVVSIRMGLPAREILDACRLYGAHLLAMRTHGRTGPSRWISGSVTEQVLRSTGTPLLVVRETRTPASPMEAGVLEKPA